MEPKREAATSEMAIRGQEKRLLGKGTPLSGSLCCMEAVKEREVHSKLQCCVETRLGLRKTVFTFDFISIPLKAEVFFQVRTEEVSLLGK